MAHAENTSQNMCCCVWGERMLGSQMPLSRKLNNDDSTYADDSDELGLFSEFIISGSEKQELVISYLLNFEKDNLNRKYAHVVPNMGIHNVALSPNNSTISAVSLDGILTLLDVVNGVKIANVSHNFVSNIWSTAFGKDDNCVFAGSGYGKVYKYGTESGQLLYSYDTKQCGTLIGLAISKDDCFVAATDYEGNLTVFDAATGKITGKACVQKPMRRICFHPQDYQLVAACDDGTVKLFEVLSGCLLDSLMGHKTKVISVDYSPNGRHFVSADHNGDVKLWDSRYNKSHFTFALGGKKPLWDVAFNKNGKKLAWVADSSGPNVLDCYPALPNTFQHS